jgi:hypothetical protein
MRCAGRASTCRAWYWRRGDRRFELFETRLDGPLIITEGSGPIVDAQETAQHRYQEIAWPGAAQRVQCRRVFSNEPMF